MHVLSDRPRLRLLVPFATLAVAALMAAVLSACSGAESDSEAAGDVPRVGLMHVGTDHVPPSLGSLTTELEEEFGWDLPDLEVAQCLEKKLLSCDLEGESIELMWRNLEPDAAGPQAEVFVGQGVDVIVAFEDQSIDAAESATADGTDPGRLPSSLRSAPRRPDQEPDTSRRKPSPASSARATSSPNSWRSTRPSCRSYVEC